MAVCPLCGVNSGLDAGLCTYHHPNYDTLVWSDFNRGACNLVHRGVVPFRPPLTQEELSECGMLS